MRIKTLIVGLGKIGMGYDYESQNTILTHCNATIAHNDFDLVGAVDTDSDKRHLFQSKFKKNVYNSIDQALEVEQPELVIVSVNTSAHYDICKGVLECKNLKAILCEKPFTSSIEEAENLHRMANMKGVKIFVNYMRNFDVETLEFVNKLGNGNLGYPLEVVSWYTKDYFTNASHLLALSLLFMGEFKSSTILDEFPISQKNHNLNFQLKFEKGNMFFFNRNQNDYTILEMLVMGPKGKFEYLDGGKKIKEYLIGKHVDYDEKSLVLNDAKRLEINLWQKYVMQNISDYINNGVSAKVDSLSAISVLKILKEIRSDKNEK